MHCPCGQWLWAGPRAIIGQTALFCSPLLQVLLILLFLPLCCLVDGGEAMLIRAVLLANGPPTGAASAWLKRGVQRGLKIWLLAVAVGGWVGSFSQCSSFQKQKGDKRAESRFFTTLPIVISGCPLSLVIWGTFTRWMISIFLSVTLLLFPFNANKRLCQRSILKCTR